MANCGSKELASSSEWAVYQQAALFEFGDLTSVKMSYFTIKSLCIN